MKVKFNTMAHSPDYSYKQGEVIDSSERPADQIERWLKRGVIAEVKDTPPVEHRAVVTPKPENKKAVLK